MKTSYLKYCMFFIFLTLFSYSSQAQESSKFKFHSVSAGIGTFTSLTDSFESNLNGLNFNADLTFDLNDYLFSLYVSTGLNYLIVEEQSYSEFNLTIGKEFRFNNWFAIEGHLGIGYFSYKYESIFVDSLSEGTLGFPLRIKSNFYLNDHWVLGLNPNFNINTYYSVILSGCFIVQYVF